MAVPTLGYPSRTEAVLALKSQGLATEAIADRIGISASAVTGLVASAGRSKYRRKAWMEIGETSIAGNHFMEVRFPQTTLRQLRPHASRRGISVVTLIQRIVGEVASSAIVDAVLDDGEGAS